jgi:transposase
MAAHRGHRSVRRKFFDVHAATASPIAKEALDRIGQPYAVEKVVNRSPPERRRQQRQLQSRPIAEALAGWADNTVRQLSRKSELAQAFRYMRARWAALIRCFDDGRLALDNNPAERALRCIAIARSFCPYRPRGRGRISLAPTLWPPRAMRA